MALITPEPQSDPPLTTTEPVPLKFKVETTEEVPAPLPPFSVKLPLPTFSVAPVPRLRLSMFSVVFAACCTATPFGITTWGTTWGFWPGTAFPIQLLAVSQSPLPAVPVQNTTGWALVPVRSEATHPELPLVVPIRLCPAETKIPTEHRDRAGNRVHGDDGVAEGHRPAAVVNAAAGLPAELPVTVQLVRRGRADVVTVRRRRRVLPPLIVSPEIDAVTSALTWNTRLALLPLTVTPAAGPVIVSVPDRVAQRELGATQGDRLRRGEHGGVKGDRGRPRRSHSPEAIASRRSVSPTTGVSVGLFTTSTVEVRQAE